MPLNAWQFCFLRDAATPEGKTSVHNSKVAASLERQNLVVRTEWPTYQKVERIWVTTPAGDAVLAEALASNQNVRRYDDGLGPIVSFTPIERRVMDYLDKRGGQAHRHDVVLTLLSSTTRAAIPEKTAKFGAVPLVMGKWCSRLVKDGLVKPTYDAQGSYQAHAITQAGKEALRYA